MWGSRESRSEPAAVPAATPRLDLSGPKLRYFFENLAEAAEATGGIERYVGALALKSALFEETLGKGRVAELNETAFYDLCAFITPARRRAAAWIGEHGFAAMRDLLTRLMADWSSAAVADARFTAFVECFPHDRKHRWARDLAAEMLHFTAPERYPLMTRWMWDSRTASGVLREIWHADDPDKARITVADDYATFAVLRNELTDFLRANGVFRDLHFYVDALCAHIYASYINDRGGSYLRSDFQGDVDPMAHTRRLLGLDAIDTETGRTRLKLIDGKAYVLADPMRLQ